MNKTQARWTLVTLTLSLTIISFLYRNIERSGYGHTGLMFIGIPFALSMLLIFSPPSKSPRTIVMKGITLFLLMTGILLWEGFICIVMAAPIFYAVAFISVVITERFLKKNPRVYCCGLGVILLIATEGTHEFNSWNRFNKVTTVQIFEIGLTTFEEQILVGPRLDTAVPIFFKLGFPLPQSIERTGAEFEVGFSGPTELENQLTVKARSIGDSTIEYFFPKDTTKIGHWMHWDSARLHWEEIPNGRIKVTFTIDYTRKLDPIWYFGPLQRYAVGRAADYLLETWFDEDIRN